MTNKEAIYDEQINPLMAQIIAICKEHKIAMVASFAVPNPDDPDLRCTSVLLADDHEPPKDFFAAKGYLMHDRPIPMTKLTVTKADGSQEVHIIANLDE